MSFFKNAAGILGMNARNLLFVQKYNSSADKNFADDKLYTKTFLESRGIGVAKPYKIIKHRSELNHFDFASLPNSFVIKPNKGYGGEGILVVVKKTKNGLHLANGKSISEEEALLHMNAILEGKYAISGTRDKVIIEERLEVHPNLAQLVQVAGLPDIRVIVLNLVPVMAMLRVPTVESQGKGNLQLGAIGVGIDIVTGKGTYASLHEKTMTQLPNGMHIKDIQIPDWDEILSQASRIQQSTGIGYLGVDLTLTKTGLKVLEVNARPGLKIQICNKIPLLARLDQVKNLSVRNPEEGVQTAKHLFITKITTTKREEKPVIGLMEPFLFYSSSGVKPLLAKIDPHAQENLIDESLEIAESVCDISIQNLRMKIPFTKAKLPNTYRAVIGGKYLDSFFIDVNKKTEVDESLMLGIQEKILAGLDAKICLLDEQIKMMSYFKILNLEEIRNAFLKDPSFHPEFVYKEIPFEKLEKLKKELNKIQIDVDHPLASLYKDKLAELKLKIQVIESRNTEALAEFSQKLFGTVNEHMYHEALSVLKNYAKKQHTSQEGKKLQFSEVQKRIEEILKLYQLYHWKVKASENSVSNMSVSKKQIIFISKNIEITEDHLQALIAHEIETHVFRAENAKLQKYKIFERGMAGYLETEEGLAMYNQNNIQVALGEKALWPALRIIGIYLGKNLSFLDLFHTLKNMFPFLEENSIFTTCVKVKRGLEDTRILSVFTKDSVYFTGQRKVEAFMKKVTKKDIELLYSGKVSLASLPLISMVKIQNPKLIPAIKS